MDKEIKERIAAINSGIIPEGYKKTKVGIVPVEWEVERFDKIATKFDYGFNAAAKAFDGENKYIRITDIDEGSNKYSFSDIVSPDCELDEDYLVEENDILFARTGASTGKTYLYNQDDGKMFFAGFLIRANINIQNNAYFIFSQTLTERYANWVRIFSMRSGQPGINAQEYKSFEILLPPLPEQQKIAEILSTQDKLIELQEKKIEQLKEMKKAYLQKMFPQKGSKYPELRFKGFTEAWEQRKLIEIVKSIDTGKSKFQSDSDNGEFAILGSTSIIGYDDSYDYDGDFILTARVGANAGSLYRYTGKAKISDNTVFIQTEKNIEFVYYMLTKFDIKQLSFGTGQPLVKASELKNLDLKMPSQIEEQQKIGSFFSQLDSLITLHQRKSEQEKQKKKALMQLLLTGIVRTK